MKRLARLFFGLLISSAVGLATAGKSGASAMNFQEDQPAPTPASSDQQLARKDGRIDGNQLGALRFRSIGPALMSGRIADIAINPANPNVWYVAVGSGNVWKTENSGTTWTPIFDSYGSYSIGCISIDPSNLSNIWVGTGEDVAGRHCGFGDGIYFSNDGGATFKNVGLKNSEHIAKIVVHPNDSNTIFVAAQGPLWSSGGERGVYKSVDGGKSWRQVLSRGEFTGATDVVIDPQDPNVLYAALYQKHRTVWALMATGPESGIYKSLDGGENWTELTNGIPGGNKGKISLAVSPQRSDVVYATIEQENRTGGIYRSENGGASWRKMSDYVSGGTGPHYYQEIWCDPHRFDSLYHANVYLGRSDDGGATFQGVDNNNKHVDNHAIAFHPHDPDTVIVGCDGGIYVSHDRCKTYRFVANLPVTQFYKIAIDNDFPFYNVVGGTQDNYTQYGPTATNRIQGIANGDWRMIIGGDGHDCAIDPVDPNIIYGESQQGYLRRYDRRTGESVDIRPQPEKGETALRFNWDAPIEISFHDHQRLYFGSKMLHRSDDRGDSWRTISPDLSRQLNRLTLPIMNQYWAIGDSFDLYAMSEYGNITAIGESPLDENLIYVGTDDGLIQITEDGGATWRRIDLISGLPEFAFVNDIKACHHNADTVFVCFDHHKYGDYRPYFMKSTDRGTTWKMLVNGIPERHLCWRVIQDHEMADLLFLGTEFGVFATVDGGENWFKFSHGMPTISVRDLEIQRRENDLVAATFGRGIYVMSDYSPLRELDAQLLVEQDFHLFPVKSARQFPQADFLGGTKGFQGDAFYVAENPPYGATFTFYNKHEFKSLNRKRLDAEKSQKEAGKPVPLPSIEDLLNEQLEIQPQLVFTIRDDAGNIVSRLNSGVYAGLQRITWNLYNRVNTQVAPGIYTVSVDRVAADGSSEVLQEAVSFEVVAVFEPSMLVEDRNELIDYFNRVQEFGHQLSAAEGAMNDTNQKLVQIETALQTFDEPHEDLSSQLVALKREYTKLSNEFFGDGSLRRQVGHDAQPSIRQRYYTASSSSYSLSAPTQTHRRSFEIAQEMYAEIYPKLSEFVDQRVPEFFEQARERGLRLPGGKIPEPAK
ncbi:MAG TPA: hypothetical protein PKD64_04360 [Pirellulaceae bacterium]|nr:hypothetical protein [Pirellulaceae bacterium]HMO91406.1 hypothetical protein [Pirellulaceae bacterium]HMP69631.1 hypothetical protein [Pirellulaceae bacterium]